MKYVNTLLRLYLVVSIPIMLTLISIRLVMTPWFLQFEYNRPDFPEDIYGFSQEDRLAYAPAAITYIIDNKDISYLGDLTFDDGDKLYNPDELRHMQDVQQVAQIAFRVLTIQIIALVVLIATVRRDTMARFAIKRGVFEGGVFTLLLIATIIITALTTWDFFFTTFHQMFFEDGTWKFFYSDTLIRLFPERFWFDAAIITGILTAIQAAGLMYLIWQQERHKCKQSGLPLE